LCCPAADNSDTHGGLGTVPGCPTRRGAVIVASRATYTPSNGRFPREQSLAGTVLFVEQQICACLPGNSDVGTPVGVHVGYADLHPGAHARSGWSDRVTGELLRAGIPAVAVQRGRLGGAGISPTVAADAFAGNQFTPAVTIQVGLGHAVRLGPRVVDQMLGPGRGAVRFRLALLPPINAVIVSASPDQIVAPVAVAVNPVSSMVLVYALLPPDTTLAPQKNLLNRLGRTREHFGQTPRPEKRSLDWYDFCARHGIEPASPCRCPVCGTPFVRLGLFPAGRAPPRFLSEARPAA